MSCQTRHGRTNERTDIYQFLFSPGCKQPLWDNYCFCFYIIFTILVPIPLFIGGICPKWSKFFIPSKNKYIFLPKQSRILLIYFLLFNFICVYSNEPHEFYILIYFLAFLPSFRVSRALLLQPMDLVAWCLACRWDLCVADSFWSIGFKGQRSRSNIHENMPFLGRF